MFSRRFWPHRHLVTCILATEQTNYCRTRGPIVTMNARGPIKLKFHGSSFLVAFSGQPTRPTFSQRRYEDATRKLLSWNLRFTEDEVDPLHSCTVASGSTGSFSAAGPTVWGALPQQLRQDTSFGQFRRKLKSHLFV